jgi:hypothetical protein
MRIRKCCNYLRQRLGLGRILIGRILDVGFVVLVTKKGTMADFTTKVTLLATIVSIDSLICLSLSSSIYLVQERILVPGGLVDELRLE